MLKRKET